MASCHQLLLWALPFVVAGKDCEHCKRGETFEELLQPEARQPGEYASTVEALWATHVEVIPITTDIGGFEPPEFHDKLADEATEGWKRFRDKVVPGLPRSARLRRQAQSKEGGALNNAFFSFQKNLFEHEGDLSKATSDDEPNKTPHPDANSSWPEMSGLPEYARLREIVNKLSRRYLIRSGMDPEQAKKLEYSIFNWAAINGPGEFHGPHTHVGEYHVGVFYARAGESSGKLRFGDPRSQSPPFGKAYFHTPRSGDLVFFPSWLSHMATVSAPDFQDNGSGEEPPYRVIFSFNIGPVQGPLPCAEWWSDPTSAMGFSRSSPIDPKTLEA